MDPKEDLLSNVHSDSHYSYTHLHPCQQRGLQEVAKTILLSTPFPVEMSAVEMVPIHPHSFPLLCR